jgi:hypothetical protein
MGDSNADGDGGGVDRDGSGGNSPSRQGAGIETSAPKIGLRWWRRCGTLSGKTPIDLTFLRQRLYIGREAMSEGTRGAHTRWWCGQGWTRARRWCGHLLARLRFCFGLRLVSGKIETSAFVSSNSENISCVTFLKHENSRKQGTGTMTSR